MTEDIVPLGEALPSHSEDDEKEMIAMILQEQIPVICVNKDTGKRRTLQFVVLYNNNKRFYLQDSGWSYFLSAKDTADINEKYAAMKSGVWVPGTSAGSAEQTGEVENSYGKEYDAIAAMTESQRIEQINEGKKRLDSLIGQRPRDVKAVTEALTETTRDVVLVNHATLLDAMQLADADAKKHTQELVDSTCKMVKSSTALITADIFNDGLMNTLVEKSNGTIIQHMTRVYLNGIAFLSYYNKLVSTSSIINKLRISCDRSHRDFYQHLLPHIKLTLEQVFLGGMRVIPEISFFNWAVGFLVHDIGKAAAVEYHEGDAAYNHDIVTEHVKVGYTSIMNKTNYPRAAGLITGYHHEYYGDPSGYGYFRPYLEACKKAKPGVRPDFCISYELDSILECQALAYFPAKVLEIIDVYDSVTDPNRKYRKPMTSKDALVMMRDEFIIKHQKIDPILFDIFVIFVQEKTRE